jgi:hypothetical protein
MFFGLTRRREGFYPQISQIVADYGGLSCRCTPSHAAGFVFCFTRRREDAKVFYPQISQIVADYGGLSCRCTPSHAAGFLSVD